MKLTDLEPQFLRVEVPGKRYLHVKTLAEAQGVRFYCPKCDGHSVLVWFRNRDVGADEFPGPGRWEVTGSGYADLTLTPSINLPGPGCGWHGFVTRGEIQTV